MAYTVLLIDYNPKSIARVRPLLGRFGARVILARCGTSGLDEFDRILPDLTLIQDVLPSLSGLEVCTRIKKSEAGTHRPVVLFCGSQSHSALVATGCDGYIEKPYPDKELLEVLTALLPGAPVRFTPEPADSASPRPTQAVPPSPGSAEAEIVDRIDSVFACIGSTGTAVASATNVPARSCSGRGTRRETAWRRT